MSSQLNSLLILLCCVQFIISARILIVLPSPSLSHHLFYRPIIRELSLRGHDVVSISPDPMNDTTLTNLTEIDIHKEAYESWNVENWFKDSQLKPESQVTKFRGFLDKLLLLGESIINSSQVQKLITNAEEHFDLFIVEMLIYPHMYGFKEHFKCPMIGITSMDTTINGMDAVGNPSNPNYYSGFFVRGGSNLSFWERLGLLWHQIDYRIFYHWEYIPKTNEILKKYFNIHKSGSEIEKTVDLILANSNPIFYMASPRVPNFIEIGGMHTRERKPLPQDLKTYLDNSPEGAIYFSLGSNVKSKNLPVNHKNSILKAFNQLPYKIIWKWENTFLSDKPKNVLIKEWFPQQDILDHPNVIAFVTQGGLQSLEEAIQCKVPMVGIPFGGDQEFNVQRIVDLGIGREIPFNEINTKVLVESIIDVATNPKYKQNINKVASLIWDQQTKPLDRAIWWIEYVIRHKGAQHLRSPAADLPWHKFLLLDIIAFLLGILIISFVFGIYLIKITLKIMYSKKIKLKES